jgi:hypothetical protein
MAWPILIATWVQHYNPPDPNPEKTSTSMGANGGTFLPAEGHPGIDSLILCRA